MLKFSVVIPVYNEEKSLGLLYKRLKSVLSSLGQSYEIIFINDFSIDNSGLILLELEKNDDLVKLVDFKEHGGQSQAMQAGFDFASGEYIVTMDADLQNAPEDIPAFWDKIREGYDMVCGWRYKRKDPLPRCFWSVLACQARRFFTKEPIHDFGCTFRIFKKEVLRGISLSGQMHRFFTLLVFKKGLKITEIKITHYPRLSGKSKYNFFNRLLPSIIDFFKIYLSKG